jgi:hypothetical protein
MRLLVRWVLTVEQGNFQHPPFDRYRRIFSDCTRESCVGITWSNDASLRVGEFRAEDMKLMGSSLRLRGYVAAIHTTILEAGRCFQPHTSMESHDKSVQYKFFDRSLK